MIYKKLRFFLIIVFLFHHNVFFSQNYPDSIKQRIISSADDTSKISAFLKIGKYYADTIPDSAFLYYYKALNLSKQLNSPEKQIESYASLASLSISGEDYEKAINFYESEIELCKKIDDKEHLRYAVGNSGVLYFYLSNYPKALTHFYELEKTAIALNDSNALATAYTNIGNIYKKLNENEKALEYFNKNLRIAKKINSKAAISNAYNNIGLIYQDNDNDKIAVKLFKKSIDVSEEINDYEGIAVGYLNLGISLDAMHQCKKALSYFGKALKLAKDINNKRLISEVEYELANIYLNLSDSEKNNTDKQKEYLEKSKNFAENAYKIAKSYHYLNNVKKTTRLLIDIYQKKNETDKALKYATEYIIVKDSLFKEENLEAIQEINAKYEIYKNNIEINKRELIISQNKKMIDSQNFIIKAGIVAGIVFLIFLSYIIGLFMRVRKKKNEISELKKLQDYLINNLPASVYLKDTNLRYKLANEQYAELLGLTLDELYDKTDRELGLETKYEDLDMQILAVDKAIEPITEKYTDNKGKEYRVSIKKVPYHDLNGNVAGVIGIVSDVTEYMNLNLRIHKLLDKTRNQKNRIENANRNISDSLTYAKTIQDAVLPSTEKLKLLFKDFFIVYKGRQIVSGDFYYANKVSDRVIFALGDCTGHGVPGGFLTMLSISFLNQIISENTQISPSEILNLLRKKIIEIFAQSGQPNKNGLDIALCSYNVKTNVLEYSGAYNSMFLLRNNELTEYKATRIPIGFYFAEKEFKNYEIQLKQNDIIYLFTDGFKDQIGGPDNKKFTSKKLKELILENHKKSFNEQKSIIENTYDNWLAGNEQFDDVSMFTVKF